MRKRGPTELIDWGRVRRDEGMRVVLGHTPESYKILFYAAILFLADSGVAFTVEEVRILCGDPPNHFNAFSACCGVVVRAGLIWEVDRTETMRPSSNKRGGGLAIYRGARGVKVYLRIPKGL